MFEHLTGVLSELRAAVASAEHEPFDGAAAARLVELFSEAERIAAAGRTLAARRVAESRLWKRQGHHTAAHWVAAATGTTITDAQRVLATAKRLEELPDTREAFQAGRLSESQVRTVADAASADPRREQSLLAAAKEHSIQGLVRACSRVKNGSVSDEQARERQLHKSRSLRHWLGDDGAVMIHARLAPVDGAVFVAAVEAIQQKVSTGQDGMSAANPRTRMRRTRSSNSPGTRSARRGRLPRRACTCRSWSTIGSWLRAGSRRGRRVRSTGSARSPRRPLACWLKIASCARS
jgi:uncharacterized protein DUF222